jgi:hypothetical protein
MECWVAKSGGREVLAEFLVLNQGFQRLFGARLGADLSFCPSSTSLFHINDHATV